MKKLIYTLKMYDYKNKTQAEQDMPLMKQSGYIVKEQYQAESTYVVVYHKDTLYKAKYY